MPKTPKLQNKLLNKLIKNDIKTKIFLINGFQLEGIIKGFDNFTIILNDGKNNKMIFKHAISTVSPKEDVGL